MKIGKIISYVGSDMVASVDLERKPLDVGKARKLYGKSVYTDKSCSNPALGRVKNIIGGIDRPYLVISTKSRGRYSTGRTGGDRFVDKEIYMPVKLKI